MPNYQRLVLLDGETYETMNPVIRAEVTAEALAARPADKTPRDIKLKWDEAPSKAARVADYLAKTALDPLLAEPLCVCHLAQDAGDMGLVRSTNMMDPASPQGNEGRRAFYAAQRRGLKVLRDTLDQVIGPQTVIVGHNHVGYDLKVLCNAWRRHQIQPPSHYPKWMGRYFSGRVFDTMLRSPGKNDYVKLERACQAYGVEHDFSPEWMGESVDGSKVGAIYRAGAHAELLEYCADDVRALFKLYMAMTCGDRCDTWDRQDEVHRAIAEIRAAGMNSDAERLAIFAVMESAGLVPRGA